MEPWLKDVLKALTWGAGLALVALLWCGAIAAAIGVWKRWVAVKDELDRQASWRKYRARPREEENT